MPAPIPVSNLQYLTLQCLSKTLRILCEDKKILIYDVVPAIKYFQRLPTSLQSLICSHVIENYKKKDIGLKVNEKHHFIFIYLQSNELYMNEFNYSLLFMNELKGNSLQKLCFRGSSFPFPENFVEESERYKLYKPLYNFIKSLSNLTVFKAVRMCDDLMFDLFSQCCPLLEEIDVELSYTVSDEGICNLCGFSSSTEVEDLLTSKNDVVLEKGCKNLKKITLDFTMASNLSVAALLKWCPKLEVLNVNPDINIGEVFSLIHGCEIGNSIEATSRRYALTTLKSSLEIDEDVLALIAHTCPNIIEITIRCCGVQRKDKNLLAHLLKLPIKNLNLTNCSTEPLLWYLDQKGSQIHKLVIEHLITCPQSVFLNRSHLQLIISMCPNLTSFALKMCGNVSISPNVPYSSFGRQLQYFTTLKELTVEGVNLQPDDIKILICRSKSIEEISLMCQNMDMIEDTLLYELLADGALRELKSLYAFRPLLTMAGLKRLLAECPKLKKVGQLSSWGIAKADRDHLIAEIKKNNWDLNIESAETLHSFIS